jgi:hypothetical protein
MIPERVIVLLRYKGALRSFRNLNRRGVPPLVSVDAFAAASRATGA